MAQHVYGYRHIDGQGNGPFESQTKYANKEAAYAAAAANGHAVETLLQFEVQTDSEGNISGYVHVPETEAIDLDKTPVTSDAGNIA